MSNIALAKPKSITGAIITCTKFGTGGTDFYVKVGRCRRRFRNGPVAETTGDGDDAPSFDAGNWQYAQLSMAGWLPAGSVSTMLLASLWDSAKNPLAASLKLSMASSQIFTVPKALITHWEDDYQRGGAVIPVFITIVATDTVVTHGTS